jgi:hypothetical protein
MSASRKYGDELRERTTRMAGELRSDQLLSLPVVIGLLA